MVTEDESIELMRSFDTGKQKTEQKVELADFMKCSVEYIPAELAGSPLSLEWWTSKNHAEYLRSVAVSSLETLMDNVFWCTEFQTENQGRSTEGKCDGVKSQVWQEHNAFYYSFVTYLFLCF